MGKIKNQTTVINKGIEEPLIDNALSLVDDAAYQSLIKELALKKKSQIRIDDHFQAKQKICNALNTKGFEGIGYEIVEKILY